MADDHVPAAQFTHTLDTDAPATLEYAPIGHELHDKAEVDDVVDDHVPLLHC